MHEPILAIIGKEIVHFEHAFVGATVVGNHQIQLGLKIVAEKFGEARGIAVQNLQMQFIAAHDMKVGGAAFEILFEFFLKTRKIMHVGSHFE
jgi:hypothetical protein